MKKPEIGIKVGQTAPNFTLPDLTGNMVSLHDYHGCQTVLFIWAPW